MGTNLFVGYAGAYQDPVTGGYPLGNGYRMYLPELMRFAQPDSMSPFGKGGVHPYAYCEADPINHADPSGHFGILGILAAAALLPLNLVPGVGKAADIVFVDVAAAGEEVTDVGLAAARAASAAEDALPSSSGTLARAAGETGDLSNSAGSSRQSVENIESPRWAPINYADLRRQLADIEGKLDEKEPRKRAYLDLVFNQGDIENPSLIQRWMRRDFTGGLRKAVRTGADRVLYNISRFSARRGRELSGITRVLANVPLEELNTRELIEEHLEVLEQTRDLNTRLEELSNYIAMRQEVNHDFVERGLP